MEQPPHCCFLQQMHRRPTFENAEAAPAQYPPQLGRRSGTAENSFQDLTGQSALDACNPLLRLKDLRPWQS